MSSHFPSVNDHRVRRQDWDANSRRTHCDLFRQSKNDLRQIMAEAARNTATMEDDAEARAK